MPIDLATVNWSYVGILSGFAFIATLLGGLISFRNRLGGAVIAAILFAVAFVYWTYYPHPNIPGPISVGEIGPASASPTAAGPASTPAAPSNPVSTVSPAPANPASTVSPAPASPPTGAK